MKIINFVVIFIIFISFNISYAIDFNFNENDTYSFKKKFNGRHLTEDEIIKIMGGTKDMPDYEKMIKEYFDKELKDPFSAQYKFEPIGKEIIQVNIWDKSDKTEYKTYCGYQILANVNAKNSFGAYSGWQDYYFLVNNNGIMIVSTFPMSNECTFPFCILSNVNKFNDIRSSSFYSRCDGIKNKGCGNIIYDSSLKDDKGKYFILCKDCREKSKNKKSKK